MDQNLKGAAIHEPTHAPNFPLITTCGSIFMMIRVTPNEEHDEGDLRTSEIQVIGCQKEDSSRAPGDQLRL
jgi:hypothetical protein